MNEKTRFDWRELFEDYKVLREKDKVRHNTADDYGLGGNWYFLGGRWVSGEWIVAYVKPREELLVSWKSHMCDGRIGSCSLVNRFDGLFVIVTDVAHIASYPVGPLKELPVPLRWLL